jgi:hypothetical protein
VNGMQCARNIPNALEVTGTGKKTIRMVIGAAIMHAHTVSE